MTRFTFWFVIAFLVSCTIGTESENPMVRDTGETLGGGNDLAKKTGWSNSGTMVSGNKSTKVSLQALFIDPGNYTVQFDLQRIDAAPNTAIRAEALVSWTVEGTTITRRISIGTGVSISGTAQGVRVVVSDVTTDGSVPGDMGHRYNVSVGIVKGSRASTPTPPTLYPFPDVDPVNIIAALTVAPAASAVVPIPQDAGVVSVNVLVQDSSGAGIAIPDGDAIVQHGVGGVNIKGYDPRSMEWVSIQPGTTDLVLFNFSAADTYKFSVTFGIDG